MADPKLRRAFQLFHALLALGLLVGGVLGLAHTLAELDDPVHQHEALVMALQTIGALLLLFPATIRWGGYALLLVLVPTFVFDLAHGHWDADPLILAAAVWFVMEHGAAWGSAAAAPDGAG